MADFDLNLSTQPFPAYRLINIAMVCVLIALVAVSAWQAFGFVKYSDMARTIRAEEQTNRVESEALGKRVADLESRLDRPESTAKLNEIGFLNQLILQKSFSWTKLFGVLEEIVPENVHLTNLTPSVTADGVTLKLTVRARSIADVKEFLKRMEMSPVFKSIKVNLDQKEGGTASNGVAASASTDIEVDMSTLYFQETR